MRFKTLCHFWQTLAGQAKDQQREQTIRSWFEHSSLMEPLDAPDLQALASCLFPNRRPDRVYGLREKSLANIVIQAWAIGISRAWRLRDWAPRPNAPDFAATVRTLVEEGGEVPHVRGPSTVVEVNHVLDHLASACPFSSPEIRAIAQNEQHHARQNLIAILQRMSGLEAEWICRLILGNLGRAQLPEEPTMNFLHPQLGIALQLHDALPDAVALIATPEGSD